MSLEIFVVATTQGGYAREDAPVATVVGVYTDAEIARKVSIAYGFGATVTPVILDHVSTGIAAHAEAIGYDLTPTPDPSIPTLTEVFTGTR